MSLSLDSLKGIIKGVIFGSTTGVKRGILGGETTV